MAAPIDPAVLYHVAEQWESISDNERAPLRNMVSHLVKYSCKIAAMPLEDGTMHLIVFSLAAGAVKDYLELQSNGAIGVVFHLYDDPDSEEVGTLSDMCDDYNVSFGIEFESDSESSDSDDSDQE